MRSRRNRMIAGVAGGLGEQFGVDPVLFRVLFAVLALPLFGWVGLLAYLLGWLLLPDQDEANSPAESLLGRGDRNAPASVEGLLLAVASALLGIVLIHSRIVDGGDVALLVLLVVGVLLLFRGRQGRRARPAAAVPPGPAPGYPPSYPQPAYSPGHPPTADFATAQFGTAQFGTAPYGTAPYGTAPYGAAEFGTAPTAPVGVPATDPTMPPPGGPPDPGATTTLPPYTYVPPAAPPPARRREPSLLGRITLSAVAVALGVLGVLNATGAHDFSVRQFLALALAVIGVGLLIGTLLGRARWLVWLGLPLTVAVVVSSTTEVLLHGGTGDRVYSPTSLDDVAGRYEVGAGTMTVDLSEVDFADSDVRSDIRVGVGTIELTVPPKVDVTVRAHAGVGSLKLFGAEDDGTGLTRGVTDEGADGAGGGELELIVNIGIGDVEVTRAQA
ncbi:MAG: hypothetical protein V7637_1834 [Mycobacteriales bacterium]